MRIAHSDFSAAIPAISTETKELVYLIPIDESSDTTNQSTTPWLNNSAIMNGDHSHDDDMEVTPTGVFDCIKRLFTQWYDEGLIP